MADPGGRDLHCADGQKSWLVIGWFTPSYRHWAVRLSESLRAFGAPHHLVACDVSTGYWEAETMRKPGIVGEFAAAYPDKTLILLDADCVALRNPAELAASIDGDVAAFVWTKAKGRGKDRARLKVMSGTMVFRPTPGARRFIDAWKAAVVECDHTDVDQTALMIALGRARDFTFQPLAPEWCVFEPGMHEAPGILHENASRTAKRMVQAPLPRQILRRFLEKFNNLKAGRWTPQGPTVAARERVELVSTPAVRSPVLGAARPDADPKAAPETTFGRTADARD